MRLYFFPAALRRLLKRRKNRLVAHRRRIGIYQLGRNVYTSPRRHLSALAAQCVQHAVAPRPVNVANVCFQFHARWNAVDRAGKDFANAHRAHGVDCAGRLCRCLKRKHQFRSCRQRIFASRHQLATRMSAFAFNQNAQARGRGNVRHQPNIKAFLFEVGSLFDVQFYKLVKPALCLRRQIPAVRETRPACATRPSP